MHRLRVIRTTYPLLPPPFFPYKNVTSFLSCWSEVLSSKDVSPGVLAENSCQSRIASGFLLTGASQFHKGGNESTNSVFGEEESRTEASSDKAHSLECFQD